MPRGNGGGMPGGCACPGGVVGGMHGWEACVVGACMAGGMHGRGCMHAQGCAWWGWACMPGEGACMPRVRAGGGCMTGKTATAVAGTHPTGMHSCSIML